MSSKTLKEVLARLRAELDTIENDLSEKDRELLHSKLRATRLPPPRRWPRPDRGRAALRPKEFEPEIFGMARLIEEPNSKRLVYHQREVVPFDPSAKIAIRRRLPKLIEAKDSED